MYTAHQHLTLPSHKSCDRQTVNHCANALPLYIRYYLPKPIPQLIPYARATHHRNNETEMFTVTHTHSETDFSFFHVHHLISISKNVNHHFAFRISSIFPHVVLSKKKKKDKQKQIVRFGTRVMSRCCMEFGWISKAFKCLKFVRKCPDRFQPNMFDLNAFFISN